MEERVISAVKKAIAESLAIPAGDIALESRLVDDLGADSLDFVDIVFMLDRELDIRVRETEFNFLTRLDFSSPDVMTGEHLTLEVADRLAKFLPALAALPDRTTITPRKLFSLITVESVAIVCQQAIDTRKTA